MRLSKYDDDTNDVEELYDSGAELEFELDEDDVVYEDEKKPFYKKPFMYICILLIGFAIFFNIRYKIVIVSGESMIPTLKDGQILIANRSFTIDRFDIVVADDVIVGANSVVLRDLKEAGTYVGSPAKKVR